MPVRLLRMAVIGDEDLVNGLRLAGVNRYRVIKDSPDLGGDVRQAFSELVSEPEIGVIAIQEEYAGHTTELLFRLKERKGLAPLVIEVPAKRGTQHGDVAGYYRTYIRKFIGFDIGI